MQPVIAVFGSSVPVPDSEAYLQAYDVGRLLAEAGLAVATGGYSGTMSAVSQGAAEAGGRVIGVTSAQIERFRPLGANEWVSEEIRYETLRERMLHLVTDNDGMIVLPGGIGTLAELSLAWSFIQVGEISPRPLALLGPRWQQTMRTFIEPEYVKQVYQDLLYFAATPQTAVSYIAQVLNGSAGAPGE